MDAEGIFDKTQQAFMIKKKTFNKLEIKENFNTIKDIHEKSTSNILNGQRLKFSH